MNTYYQTLGQYTNDSEIREQEQIRAETLRRLCNMANYKNLQLATKNKFYDIVKSFVEKELFYVKEMKKIEEVEFVAAWSWLFFDREGVAEDFCKKIYRKLEQSDIDTAIAFYRKRDRDGYFERLPIVVK